MTFWTLTSDETFINLGNIGHGLGDNIGLNSLVWMGVRKGKWNFTGEGDQIWSGYIIEEWAEEGIWSFYSEK